MPEIMEFSHAPVLLDEVLDGLSLTAGATVVDGTVGLGGHAAAILDRIAPGGRLIGVDADREALSMAQRRLGKFGKRVTLIHGNFADLLELLRDREVGPVNGVLFDLGPSSYQLESPGRGFSFRLDGPLDMRMDRGTRKRAADLVNRLDGKRLEDLIRGYGEERWAGRISRAIVREREGGPIETTAELAALIARCVPRRGRARIHPATRTFMALRIATNDELEVLKKGICAAAAGLRAGGRLCVISFHSLEDRIVKNEFRRLSGKCCCPPDFPVCRCGAAALLKVVTPKPITPTREEVAGNRRARSAKLRVAEML